MCGSLTDLQPLELLLIVTTWLKAALLDLMTVMLITRRLDLEPCQGQQGQSWGLFPHRSHM